MIALSSTRGLSIEKSSEGTGPSSGWPVGSSSLSSHAHWTSGPFRSSDRSIRRPSSKREEPPSKLSWASADCLRVCRSGASSPGQEDCTLVTSRALRVTSAMLMLRVSDARASSCARKRRKV